MSDTLGKPQSFWNRPEGWTGRIMIGLMIAAGVYCWGSIVPFIESMLESTLKVGLMLGVIVVVIAAISDKNIRAAGGALFKGIARTITNIMVNIDPLGILKDHIQKLKSYLDEINNQLGVINGQEKSLQIAIETNNKSMQHSMQLIEVAKKQNNLQAASLELSDITRKKQSNEEYMKLLTKINTIYQFMCKMRDNSAFILEDTIRQVDEEERKYKTINAAANALSRVKKFFTNDDELANDALAHLEENFTQKLGAIDDFMIRSKGVLDKMDLTNDANLQEGIQMFSAWEKDNAKFFADVTPNVAALGTTQARMAVPGSFSVESDTPVSASAPAQNKFLDI